MSATQQDSYELLDRYLAESWFGVQTGPLVLILCLFVWLNSILNDLNSSIRLTMAAVQLKGQATVITEVDHGKHHHIVTLSSARAAVFVAVQMCRMAVAVALLIGGMLFLRRTTNTIELLLNTVGLELYT